MIYLISIIQTNPIPLSNKFKIKIHATYRDNKGKKY